MEVWILIKPNLYREKTDFEFFSILYFLEHQSVFKKMLNLKIVIWKSQIKKNNRCIIILGTGNSQVTNPSYKTELRVVTSQFELLTLDIFNFIIISELLSRDFSINIFELETQKSCFSKKIRVSTSEFLYYYNFRVTDLEILFSLPVPSIYFTL